MPLKKSLKSFGLLYGSSAPMEHLYRQMLRVADADAAVLLVGESGTGKELIAKSIYQLSTRSTQAFVAVNCGAIPAHLIEAALFGHEKGSFTGAVKQHRGYFEHASGGTLFLDEITEMPTEMQAKLLRVLESGRFMRVGGDHEVQVDVRLVAATNRDLGSAVQEGYLRADLMYRLAVFPIRIPPLRERIGDIELLALHFLDVLNRSEGTHKMFLRHSLDLIRLHSWPGNVRELKNMVQRAFILCTDALVIEEGILRSPVNKPATRDGGLQIFIGTPLAQAQRETIAATLKHFRGNKHLTAQALGVSLKTLYNRLKQHG